MRENLLECKNKANKSFSFSDLRKNTREFFNVKLTREKLSRTFHANELATISQSVRVTNTKNIFGTNYFVTENGNVLKYANGSFLAVYKASNGEVELEEIIFKGIESLLILSKLDGATIISLGENIAVNISYSKVHLAFGNILFVGVENKLHFSSFSSMQYFPVGNFITFPHESGKIVALIGKGKKLLIFCERAVYSLSLFGETLDYKIDRLFDVSGLVDGNSVCSVDGSLLFLSDKKLVISSGNKFTELSTAMDFAGFTVNGKAKAYNGKYLLPLIKESEQRRVLFIYDLSTGEEEMFDGCYLACDGGLVVKSGSGNILAKLDGEESEKVGVWTSTFLDFSTMERKAIKQIVLCSGGEAQLIVRSEHGEKTLSIKEGVNVKRLNLSGRIVQLEFAGKGLSISNMEIIYRIKGA